MQAAARKGGLLRREAFGTVPRMKASSQVTAVLVGLVAVAALSSGAAPGNLEPAQGPLSYGWLGFLYGIPLILGVALLSGQRWALMAAVMYGTVGLALDLSTVVQELTRGPGETAVLTASGITGLLNFLLILLGGRGFLDAQERPSP